MTNERKHKMYQKTEMSDTSRQSFLSETFKYRIVVSLVTTGTEKQIDYANSLKVLAMQEVDRFSVNFLKRVAANKQTQFETWRNDLLSAIDADTDARQVLDKLADVRMDIEDIMTAYNILPQQYA